MAGSTRTTILIEPVTSVTQCNDAINGGGGTLRCSVQISNEFIGLSPGATATTAGATITQCNGSANGGEALVICSANVTSNAVAAGPARSPSSSPTPTPTVTPVPTATPAPTLPATSTTDQITAQRSGTSPLVLAGLLLLVALSLIAASRPFGDRWDVR